MPIRTNLSMVCLALAIASCVYPSRGCGEGPGSPKPPPPEPEPELTDVPAPKRLLYFQPVAHTSRSAPGQVAPYLCSPTQGWRAHVEKHLQPLVQRLGPNAFDWWGHRIGGSWVEARMPMDATATSVTEFEQLDLARQRFPKLVDFAPLADFGRANRMELYAHIGFPRCDAEDRFRFAAVPGHCDAAQMQRWYGEFVRFGFKGVGHDWGQNLGPDSGALKVNFPYLRRNGIDPFIEAIPRRKDSHLLGLSVVVNESRLLHTERRPETFFTVDEIIQAGGRVIILVARPPEPPVDDIWQWRFDRAVVRLREGRTVAVNLVGLAREGYPLERLVEISRSDPPRVGRPD